MGWGWCLNIEYMHSAQKARDTAIDDERYDVRCNQQRPVGKNMTDST